MKKSTNWTAEEIDLLSENYDTETASKIGKLIGRSDAAVRNKAKELGLSDASRKKTCDRNFKTWTEQEDEYLRSRYGTLSSAQIGQALSRSVFAVRKRSGQLQLREVHAICGTAVLNQEQDARFLEMSQAFRQAGINPRTVKESAAGYVLAGKKDIDFLLHKAKYQPDNYHLKRASQAEKTRIFFEPSEDRSLEAQALAWAKKHFGAVRQLAPASAKRYAI